MRVNSFKCWRVCGPVLNKSHRIEAFDFQYCSADLCRLKMGAWRHDFVNLDSLCGAIEAGSESAQPIAARCAAIALSGFNSSPNDLRRGEPQLRKANRGTPNDPDADPKDIALLRAVAHGSRCYCLGVRVLRPCRSIPVYRADCAADESRWSRHV